nr:hypothetical protein [uncultured bacterium]
MGTVSKYLSDNAVNAFERLGDFMMPRAGQFPSFKELGVIVHVDGIMEHVPEEDRSALNMLLSVLSFFPDVLLNGFLTLVGTGSTWTGPVGGFFRQLKMGLQSVIVTLYFSGKHGPHYTGPTPLDLTGYRVNAVR